MLELAATCARGVEEVTARELEALGAKEVKVGRGVVRFQGDLRLVYLANLKLRSASRVLIRLKDFAANSPEMLYDQVRRVAWENYFGIHLTFAVDTIVAGAKPEDRNSRGGEMRRETESFRGGGFHSQTGGSIASRLVLRPSSEGAREPSFDRGPSDWLRNSHFAGLKIKDAVCDRFRQERGERPNVDAQEPHVLIHALFYRAKAKDPRTGKPKPGPGLLRCTLSLDTSGRPLHERGYRDTQLEAPVKENLAAALVLLSGYDPAHHAFLDPMCGSGTIAIEAALLATRTAPGLLRPRFSFMNLSNFDQNLWEKVRTDVEAERVTTGLLPIWASDAESRATAVARTNARRAGVETFITFKRQGIEDVTLPESYKGTGTMIMNPPYGERLGRPEELEPLYRAIGTLARRSLRGWNACVFTGNGEATRFIGMKAEKKFALFNGAIECRLLVYPVMDAPPPAQ